MPRARSADMMSDCIVENYRAGAGKVLVHDSLNSLCFPWSSRVRIRDVFFQPEPALPTDEVARHQHLHVFSRYAPTVSGLRSVPVAFKQGQAKMAFNHSLKQ